MSLQKCWYASEVIIIQWMKQLTRQDPFPPCLFVNPAKEHHPGCSYRMRETSVFHGYLQLASSKAASFSPFGQ
jgi:hypothetical protein